MIASSLPDINSNEFRTKNLVNVPDRIEHRWQCARRVSRARLPASLLAVHHGGRSAGRSTRPVPVKICRLVFIMLTYTDVALNRLYLL